jgi:hypothetical protein
MKKPRKTGYGGFSVPAATPDSKSPGDWPGLDFDGRDYIFDLQVLVVASHVPPALSQSAFVLAVVTSAAKAEVAKATPRASAKA